jgi:predicted NUDIX family NTP pyrophosphohydrolase
MVSLAVSSGLMMYCADKKGIKVFLVHPGGPFFQNKDKGYWSIPKGLVEKNEELFDTAKREFNEETGLTVPEEKNEYISLGSIIQKSGKKVYCWAFKTDKISDINLKCNTFDLEWPPHSKQIQKFPEVDRGEFFNIDEAKIKMNTSQIEFIERLLKILEEN